MSGSKEITRILRDLVLMIDEGTTDQAVVEEARRLVDEECSVTPFDLIEARHCMSMVDEGNGKVPKLWGLWLVFPGMTHADAAKEVSKRAGLLGEDMSGQHIAETRLGKNGAITRHSVKRRVMYESQIVYAPEDLAPGGCRGPELPADA